jgi:hypothetical protein
VKNIFVSYNFNDRNISHSIKGMSKENSGPVNGRFIFVKNDMSAEGSLAIDREIKDTMQHCDVALFLVGNNNHNSPWIEREAQLSTSKNLPIIVMKLPQTNGGIPNALKGRNYKECSWNAHSLSQILS